MLNASEYLMLVAQRGTDGKPIERVYRWIRNEDVLMSAYMNIYANDGATTIGTDGQDTIDGMSLERINRISDQLLNGTFKWKPARRVYIPKANGKTRPLSIPSWTDKLVQEAMRMILAAYYEPQFSNFSHGFRTKRGCHTALNQLANAGGWTGTKWFIEGDIKGCFDNIDHAILMEILSRSIRDDRFAKLVREMLKAGYLEDWKYNSTYSGTPQGGLVSPLLSNIYLNELDKYVTDELIPEYTKGKARKEAKGYGRLRGRIARAMKKGDKDQVKEVRKRMKIIPSGETHDPNFRRLRYVRYADDFLLGFAGPKDEALEIKERLQTYLKEQLKLDMSVEKTLITHASTQPAKFLGYEVLCPISNTKQTENRRAVNGKVQLRMPTEVLKKGMETYSKKGKTIQHSALINNSEYDIVQTYAAKLRGLNNYYCMAINVSELYDLKNMMYYSLAKTIADKQKSTMPKVFRKYAKKIEGMSVIEIKVEREGKPPLIATFGKEKCRRDKNPKEMPDAVVRVWTKRTELLKRMMADKCELCGSSEKVEVHHIRKLKDIQTNTKGQKDKPAWVKKMIALRRKTLVVCRKCHNDIHSGKYDGPSVNTSK